MYYLVGVFRVMICFVFLNNLFLVIYNVVNMVVIFVVLMFCSGYVILMINCCLMELIKLLRRLFIVGLEILGY